MTTSNSAAPMVQPSRATLGWAMRRALLGILILTAGVALAACLLYFAIDSDAEARAAGDMPLPVITKEEAEK
jgi:hypothetical protein